MTNHSSKFAYSCLRTKCVLIFFFLNKLSVLISLLDFVSLFYTETPLYFTESFW